MRAGRGAEPAAEGGDQGEEGTGRLLGGARSGLSSTLASLAARHPAPPGALAASAVREPRQQREEEPRALR